MPDSLSPNLPSARFLMACSRFDQENSKDPNSHVVDGIVEPRELFYSRQLTAWILKLAPNASEELRLAGRSQHLCRWLIPRDSYPANRLGYLQWRNDLKKMHATKAAAILEQCGYDLEMIARVQSLNLKKDFPRDPDSQVLEDALCLVFLEFQFADLASRTEEEKMVNVLRKSWNKMTPAGRERALSLPLSPRERGLLEKALASA